MTAQYGKVEADGPALDTNGAEKKAFVFKGFVFRSDDRGPGHKTMKRGFTSRNDLSVPANRTEAMGLGVMTEGKAGGWGATGQSGVSTAKTVDGAIGYINPGGTFYVIDTTKPSFLHAEPHRLGQGLHHQVQSRLQAVVGTFRGSVPAGKSRSTDQQTISFPLAPEKRI